MSGKETPDLLAALRQCCVYHPNTGKLYWRPNNIMSAAWRAKYVGEEAFTHTYANGRRNGKFMQVKLEASRVAWALAMRRWPVGDIDHIDRDPSNNRLTNLRDVSETVNLLNTKLSKNNKTGVHGVSVRGNRFVAMLGYKRKLHYLGTFNSVDEAYAARVAFGKSLGLTILDGKELIGVTGL